jgi:hypothetical protein
VIVCFVDIGGVVDIKQTITSKQWCMGQQYHHYQQNK